MTKSAQQVHRTCAFCGGTGLSKEHVWPKWLKKYLPHIYIRTKHAVSTTTPRTHALIPGNTTVKPGRLHRPGDPRAQRLRVVCQNCNVGWMSRLQEAAKPILVPLIQGTWSNLSLDDSKTLAAWATMFTMVLEFADPDTQVTTARDRRTFKETLIPPEGWHVWIAPFTGKMWKGVFNHFMFDVKRANALDMTEALVGTGIRVQSTSIAPGALFIQTVSSVPVYSGISPEPHRMKFGLRQIWPTLISQGISIALDDHHADEASRWYALPDPATRRAWESGLS